MKFHLKMDYNFIHVLLVFLLVIISLIGVIVEIKKTFNTNKMACYLNSNSTCLIGGNKRRFNTSDIAYEEVQKIRREEENNKDYIRNLLGASEDTEIIFTSGATESIATVLNWSKSCNKYGIVCGSDFDHNTVKLNCDNQELKYKKVDINNIVENKSKFDLNCGCVFLTHVSPHTGEIMPMEKISNLIDDVYLEEINSETDDLSEVSYQYRPLVFLDVSQSIGKIPIKMKEWNVDGIFFSLHKLGGELNCGVLLIKNSKNKPFKPLIAGKQQSGLRGGTYNSYAYLNLKNLIENYMDHYDKNGCKNAWEKIYKKLTLEGLDVVEPEFEHLYNTILINTNKCSFNMIAELSEYGIYTSGKTSCDSIDTNENSTLRLSFMDGNINDKTINKIIEIVNKYENQSEDLSEEN